MNRHQAINGNLVKIFPFCHLSALCVLGGKQIRERITRARRLGQLPLTGVNCQVCIIPVLRAAKVLYCLTKLLGLGSGLWEGVIV